MCEFRGSNGNGFGDIWWTRQTISYILVGPSIDCSILVFVSFRIHSIPSSLFSLIHLPLSFSPRVLTISVSLLNCFTYVCYISALALISSLLINPILVIPIFNLNILIAVLPSNYCSNYLSAQVSLPYIIPGLMTGLQAAI